MRKFKTIDDLDVSGKRVLVRCDLNAPMKDGRITDNTRLVRAAPTMKELIDKDATVIVISHMGRPQGTFVESMSLRPVAEELSKVLDRPVTFIEDCVGAKVEFALSCMPKGNVALLENLRFHPGEEMNAAGFAGGLAAFGDIYVGDAFSCAHRSHASIETIARLLPSVAGRLMQSEVSALAKALGNPQRPVAALVGGSKISTKLGVLENLTGKMNLLFLGGGMANTFLHAKGFNVGKSLCERDMADAARAIMESAEDKGCEIMLPKDAVTAPELIAGAECETTPVEDVAGDAMILDVGPATVGELSMRLSRFKTVVWNGPLGAFETPPFDAGTNARAVARMTANDGLNSIAGGGDTLAALANAGASGSMSYVSTAGGAFLQWLEGKELPGVAVLYE